MHARAAIHAQAARAFKVDEQQAHVRVEENISQALEHAVAVVARKGQRVRVHHAYEPRAAALAGAVGLLLGIRRRHKEQGTALDECAIVEVKALRASTSASRSASGRVAKRSCSCREPS